MLYAVAMKQDQAADADQTIIHLKFQNMELTSVHQDSGQLFERCDVVHVISVQPHEVPCFIASADKKKYY